MALKSLAPSYIRDTLTPSTFCLKKRTVQDPFPRQPQHRGMLCHITSETVRHCVLLKVDLKRFFSKKHFKRFFQFLHLFNIEKHFEHSDTGAKYISLPSS